MKYPLIALLSAALFTGCAAYKQLQPEPPVSPKENGYIELKDDDEWFELDQGKKYYIAFPAPEADNFYLLIDARPTQGDIQTAFASAFDEDKGGLAPLANEAATDATEEAWPVDRSVQNFYWIIEKVDKDMQLHLKYRYLPRWRYKYETQSEAFRQLLSENTMPRETYNALGTSIKPSALDFDGLLATLKEKSDALNGLHDQLTTIEELFPPEIKHSADPAYRDFMTLKEDIEVEQTFQENFRRVVEIFRLENRTRSSVPAFTNAAPRFNAFLKEKQRYPEHITRALQRALDARLDEVPPFYDEFIKRKKDTAPIDLDVEAITRLYNAVDKTPGNDYRQVAAFVTLFNKKARLKEEAQNLVEQTAGTVTQYKKWPGNGFFAARLAELDKALNKIPAAGFGSSVYKRTPAARKMTSSLHALRNKALTLKEQYRRAEQAVRELNRLAGHKDYLGMIHTIAAYPDLPFFKTMYADLDKKALSQQKQRILSALDKQQWAVAEKALRSLHQTRTFINPAQSVPLQKALVRAFEDTLVNRVERLTRQRVNRFVNEKYNELNAVSALYDDPVFEPVWDITFTSGSKARLAARKAALQQRLTRLKEIEFPARAITKLYGDFIKNINDNGVARARAIVTHGQHYKGNDRKIKTMIAECDPWASKWLTKAGDYRLVYALPSTSNPKGANTYVFRINIRIPTDARFPVYDLNLKLPPELGRQNGSWYQQMTMNKKILKPEGRFTILAPNKENGYTAVVTPLSVEKDGDNVLEVRFRHKGLKVFPISVMAQKPILRKN